MADEPDNLVLTYLRRIDAKVDRMIDDLSDVRGRMIRLDEGMQGVLRRMDRLDARFASVEARICGDAACAHGSVG